MERLILCSKNNFSIHIILLYIWYFFYHAIQFIGLTEIMLLKDVIYKYICIELILFKAGLVS